MPFSIRKLFHMLFSLFVYQGTTCFVGSAGANVVFLHLFYSTHTKTHRPERKGQGREIMLFWSGLNTESSL